MIGERIGNYVITEKLGEGGMGEVYLATHPQIGKRVALKVLHPELSSNEEITSRFFQEAKAVNDISHPNIVDILDFGSMPTERGNIVYLVMELLNGKTLTKLVEQGPMEPMRAVRIMKQVADALMASHERGIVHRDLKPDNIMLIPRGRDPEFVKLLDFGIAKVKTGAGSASKTRTGMVIGTPIYMSPEQCEGKGDIDHRTDVYALGTVMYELICGAPPFTGEGYAEILVKQLTETPQPVTQRRPGISRYLESIILKALAKRREDRFQTMREVLDALSNPQEFVDARGGVAAFTGPRSNPPTGPQLPTPYIGAPNGQPTPYIGAPQGQPTPYIGAPSGQPTPLVGAGYNTPLTGQPGMPTPVPTPMHGQATAGAYQIPTPVHGQAGMPTPMHGQATPMYGQGMPTPMHGQAGMPTPMHGQATPTPFGAPMAPYQTTLSQGVGELGRAGRGTAPPATIGAGSSKKVLIGAIVGVAVIAGVIVVVVAGGSGGGSKPQAATTPSEPAGSAATAATTPTPPTTTTTTTEPAGSAAPTPAIDPTPTTTTAPAVTVTRIRVETTPGGASVFVGSETTERCKTPCTAEVPRTDGDATIMIKLAGYADEKRSVSAKGDIGLNLELAKKRTGGTARPGTGSAVKPNTDKPIGDNTMNPFDN